MANQTLVRNDTGPDQVHICKDESGTVVDVTAATAVRFHMEDSSGTLKVDSAGTVTDGTAGEVTYVWTADDTDTTGTFKGEFEVTLSTGKIETFPKKHKIRIRIIGDIN